MTVENYKVEITDQGKEQLHEIIERVFGWMGPENTVGDFMTTFMEEVVEEWLGEDVCSLTFTEIENDKEAQKKFFAAMCKSPMMEVFKKIKNPNEFTEL